MGATNSTNRNVGGRDRYMLKLKMMTYFEYVRAYYLVMDKQAMEKYNEYVVYYREGVA